MRPQPASGTYCALAAAQRDDPLRIVALQRKNLQIWRGRPASRLFHSTACFIHVGDRESDIFELYCLTRDLGSHFLVRACVDRLAGDGGHTIADEMNATRLKGLHRIEVRTDNGEMTMVAMEIKFKRIIVQPPIGKQKRYPALDLTVIHATERGAPKGRKPIIWKLITDLPVRGRADAIEKINWYAMRWKIEMFHKVLKSGCQAEASKLRTAERLANLMAVFCILSWRVLWLTMLARAEPDASPSLAFTENEIGLLDRLVSDAGNRRAKHGTLSFYLIKLARLGRYRARAGDLPPNSIVIWRGLGFSQRTGKTSGRPRKSRQGGLTSPEPRGVTTRSAGRANNFLACPYGAGQPSPSNSHVAGSSRRWSRAEKCAPTGCAPR